MTHLPELTIDNLSTFPHKLDELLTQQAATLTALLQQPLPASWDTLIVPLETMENAIERFWSPLAHLHAVTDTPALRDCYQICLPKLIAHESAISQNETLYSAIQSINTAPLNTAQQYIINQRLRDFTLAGVQLDAHKKQRLETIYTQLSDLSNQFEHNLLDAEQAFQLHITDPAQLNGLPTHLVDSACLAAEKNQLPGWLLTLNDPTYLAIMTCAVDRELRRTFHQAYHTRASDTGPSAGLFDNAEVINELLTLRYEAATLLGFSNYATLSLATKMVATPEQVVSFLVDLLQKAKPKAQQEYQSLCAFSATHLHLNTLEPWDISYVSKQQKQHEYAIDDEALRAYFPLPHVMRGLFTIIHTLFGINVRAVEGNVSTWHTDVCCYALHDASNNLRGYLYVDLFARAHKRGGAWMDSLQSRFKRADGAIQLPIATLTCNFADTASTQPATLSHDEVITLFHEMGHCLHHLLTQVDYLSASGIHGVEWDAVELPSQLLEHWCWTPETMSLLSSHVETGEPLPTEVFQQLRRSQQFQSALRLMRQLELALFDFHLHCMNPHETTELSQTVAAVLTDIQSSTRITPTADYIRTPHSFSHIFAGGYAAGYYSYLWAEVLSSDAFQQFQTNGVLNSHTGRALLTHILEVGGSRSARESYRCFQGRDATLDAFLEQHGIPVEGNPNA